VEYVPLYTKKWCHLLPVDAIIYEYKSLGSMLKKIFRRGTMSYAIMRFEKRHAENLKGMENHNERKTENHSNKEIETDKSHLNYDLISCSNYKEAIDKELKEGYTKTTAIRKDAVVATEFLFTSDTEFFDKLSPGEEKKYFEECLDFLKEKFGEKNIISAKVHKDEKTPHLHAVIIPLHNDGSLSMKKYLDSKKDLMKLQDSFFEKISKEFPQLERGQSKTITESKHKDLKELKKETNYLTNQIETTKENNSLLKSNLEELKIQEIWVKETYFKYKNNKALFSKNEIQINKDDFYKISNIAFNNICQSLETKNIKKLENDNNKLSSDISNFKKEISTLKNNLENLSKEFEVVKKFIEKKELMKQLECHKSEISWNISKQYLGTRDLYLNQILKKQEPNDFEKNLIKTLHLRHKGLEI
jgi:archaellum component FlaC